MYIFSFKTDPESKAFFEVVVNEMVRLFSISQDEALGRVNRAWKGMKIYKDHIIFHEDETYWANGIYYGHNSEWWLNPPNLKPLTYP